MSEMPLLILDRRPTDVTKLFISDNTAEVMCLLHAKATYESVLNVGKIYLRDLLLEFLRILDYTDAAVNVILKPVDV